MPKIKAFKGARPRKNKVLDVIAKPFESFYTEQAKDILQTNKYSFLHAIEPLIDNPFQRGPREEIIFKKAKEHFEEFLEDGILVQDKKSAIYIYRTVNKGFIQTGIWCCTLIDDYLDNTLKKHEFTRADREKDLIEYLQNTGIDANPVLVTYQSKPEINLLIDEVTKEEPEFHFDAEGQEHFLWKIDNEEKIKRLTGFFAELPCSYIADGHHRAAASSLAGIERRKNNLKHNGTEEYNYFTTLYFSTDQLLIFEFQRLVKDLNGYSEDEFLEKLKQDFTVSASDSKKPEDLHQFKMYLSGKWYELLSKDHIRSLTDPVKKLDVSILQNHILLPVLGINDPRTDKRIQFVGGLTSVSDIIKKVDSGEMKVAFFLHPTSINELIEVADSGNVMPPKSTWFEPKLHCGLVVHIVD
jgi:uncharacterized protein (DUF1015 family)